MNGFYNYLEGIMPLKRILISLSVGMVSLFIVLFSGLSSDFVRSETVASRAFSAFSFTGLVCFIIMMSGEEYAIFKTKRELERFIDDAPIAEADDFNRDEYLRVLYPETETEKAEVVDSEPKPETEIETEAEDAFRPLDFNALSTPK